MGRLFGKREESLRWFSISRNHGRRGGLGGSFRVKSPCGTFVDLGHGYIPSCKGRFFSIFVLLHFFYSIFARASRYAHLDVSLYLYPIPALDVSLALTAPKLPYILSFFVGFFLLQNRTNFFCCITAFYSLIPCSIFDSI